MDMQSDVLFQERQLLEQLHTRLIVPLATTDRLLGFISLGEKLSEEPYSKEDKELLRSDWVRALRRFVTKIEGMLPDIQLLPSSNQRLWP